MDIIKLIGVGKDNAVTRQQLCERLGKGDRVVRQMIEEARNNGFLICNAQDSKGYYMAANSADVLAQLNRNENRAKSILVQQKHLRAAYRRMEGKDQTAMEGF